MRRTRRNVTAITALATLVIAAGVAHRFGLTLFIIVPVLALAAGAIIYFTLPHYLVKIGCSAGYSFPDTLDSRVYKTDQDETGWHIDLIIDNPGRTDIWEARYESVDGGGLEGTTLRSPLDWRGRGVLGDGKKILGGYSATAHLCRWGKARDGGGAGGSGPPDLRQSRAPFPVTTHSSTGVQTHGPKLDETKESDHQTRLTYKIRLLSHDLQEHADYRVTVTGSLTANSEPMVEAQRCGP